MGNLIEFKTTCLQSCVPSPGNHRMLMT